MTQYKQYIEDVLSGAELVSEITRLTVSRHLSDLEAQENDAFQFVFSEKEAAKALGFLRALRHPSGERGIADKPFNVQPNQAFITACLFGWRRKDDGARRFTEVYLEVSRKWGKSLYAAFVELYVGFYEGATGAGVFTAATTRDQADEVFRAAKGLAERLRADSDKARKSIRILANSINDTNSGCFIQKVSADAGNLDGKNPICAVIDEYHAHDKPDVKEVMESGQGTWKTPMLFIITTAGFNKQSPCYTVERPNAINVLRGDKQQGNLFAMIFTHDTDDADGVLNLDPDDPEQAKEIIRLAKKSNPNLGSTPTHNFILSRVRSARNKGGSIRVQVLTKNFNCWQDAPKVWILDQDVKASMKPLMLEDMKGRPCFVGIDLAAVSDISAVVATFPEHEGQPKRVFCFCFLPEQTAERKSDEYGGFIRRFKSFEDLMQADRGYLEVTPGNITDYGYIKKRIIDLSEMCNVKAVAFDQWNAYQMAAELEAEGFTMIQCRQSYGHLSEPCKNIEKNIVSGEVEIQENPVLSWMFQNVVLDYDANGNIKPNKAKSSNKIDGVAGMAISYFAHLTTPETKKSYLTSASADLIVM